jgi:predicted nucleic acid-binding protein
MIVIDSNVAVWAVLPSAAPSPIDVLERFEGWEGAKEELIAPMLWISECTSALRRYVANKVLSDAEAETALKDVLLLGVQLMPVDHTLAPAALKWAARIGQSKAYDGFYLALAEEEGADFWSADERLVNAARAAGASWAHWIGEG